MKKILFGAIIAANVTAVHAIENFWRYMTVSATGTYTKSTNNGLSVGDMITTNSAGALNFPAGNSPAGTMDGGRRWIFVDPSFEGDYALGLAYRFRGTNTRLFASYDHFNDSEGKDANSIRNLGYEFGGVPPVGGGTVADTRGFTEARHRSDELRIGFVNHVPVHPRVTLDSSFFFEYDRVNRTIDESIQGVDATGVVVAAQTAVRSTKNRVSGWGPGLSAATHIRPFNGHYLSPFGFFAGLKTIMIYTDNDFDQVYQSAQGPYYGYTADSTNSLVGKLDITFGVDMNGCVCSNLGGLPLNIALGMRYMNMFNVFKNGNAAFNPVEVAAGAPAAAVFRSFAASSGPSNDWGRIGPFLQFRLGGSRQA